MANTHGFQEHIVQWHPSILSKLAIVPQRIMNSYPTVGQTEQEGVYKGGDFVVRFAGCEQIGRDCVGEAEQFSKQWRAIFRD